MPDPKNIFVKIDPTWSYNYMGSVKEFVQLEPNIIAEYYNLACAYLTIRHNFVSGHLDNVSYTNQIYTLFKPFENTSTLHSVIAYCTEGLYRLVRPVLDMYRRVLARVTFVNDDKGDVNGLVFQYVEHYPITTLQF
ncbi:hypothetical protein D3C81_313340 [compost metagenome]